MNILPPIGPATTAYALFNDGIGTYYWAYAGGGALEHRPRDAPIVERVPGEQHGIGRERCRRRQYRAQAIDAAERAGRRSVIDMDVGAVHDQRRAVRGQIGRAHV